MRTPILLAALAGLLYACSSTSVGVDRDPDYDFTGKQTYAWKEGVPAQNELHQKRIVADVDGELARRGLRRVEGGPPDLWVLTEVASHREVRSTGSSVGVGVGRATSWGRLGVSTSTGDRVYEVDVGTLVIAVLDGPSGELVWRAQAEDTVGNDPERTAQAIREAVEKSFAKFPLPAAE